MFAIANFTASAIEIVQAANEYFDAADSHHHNDTDAPVCPQPFTATCSIPVRIIRSEIFATAANVSLWFGGSLKND